MNQYETELARLREENLFRSTRSYRRRGMTVQDEDGREYLDFSSNDYLGLSQHPALISVAQEAAETFGVGSSASRLITGTTPAHASLEATLAEKKEAEAALLFSTGYMTAMGVIPSVVGKEDVIIMDKLAHACLIDAARASGARLRVFPHNNLNKLEDLLQAERARVSAESKILILTESVFSMDGDLCPLKEVVELKERYGALLLLDEAHGLGVLGAHGMGLAEEMGLQKEVDLQMGTLGKAAGGAGGYIATTETLKDLIINKGRSFIFTTAPPPAQAVVAEKALEIISSAEGNGLRERLFQHRSLLGKAVGGDSIPSAIYPILIGENAETLQSSELLRENGFLVPGIRFPTVPRGSARLRVTLSAAHKKAEVEKFHSCLSDLSIGIHG